ncbi:hypothetical protein K438DRAFT_1981801 [Mycena galopus ATCC 62051]|nr:hypothetical protein K438DRAFT_1981801 [Mycena galopus ATCC 62051]
MESRINTNYVPSDKEVEYIRMDLVSLNQELARIDARIRELFTQRDQVQADIDSREALISFPGAYPQILNAVMSAQEAPLLLCRICSPWRTIALSTPRLWASLHIPLDYILRHEPRKPAVIEWLQRSAACPISLTLVFENQWNDPLPGGSALLKALINFAARWRHAEFVEFSPQGHTNSQKSVHQRWKH